MPVSDPATSRVEDEVATGAAGRSVEVVVVAAADRRCGFRLLDVEEVQRVVRITPLPGAPDGVEGVVDRRGAIVPVLDGRRRVGAAPRAVRLSDRLVFLRTPGRVVALRVDGVLGVAEVAPPTPLSPMPAAPHALHELGVARLDDGLLVVHDVERFLTAEDSSTLDAALAELDEQAP